MTKNRDPYIAQVKEQLDALDARIETLQAQAHEAKVEARERYQAELTKVRHQSRLAMAQLDDLKKSGEDSWDKMVAEMEKVRDAFTSSFHYFKSQV